LAFKPAYACGREQLERQRGCLPESCRAPLARRLKGGCARAELAAAPSPALARLRRPAPRPELPSQDEPGSETCGAVLA
jgi:hypothetical protein